jgi:2-hydroxy-6-oxonona-2,4-dienedioate hydrolase
MDPQYEATSRVVDTGVGPIHHHEHGVGEPLLMIHGSGPGVSGWANFSGNLATFGERYRCVVPDLPGFGRTPIAEGNPADATGAMVALLDALQIERTAIIGNSLGGGVGAELAARHPDRVSRLVAIGGLGINLLSAAPAEGIKLLVAFMEDPTRARLVEWMQSMVYDPAVLTEELIDMRFEAATRPEVFEAARRIYSRGSLRFIQAAMNGKGAGGRLSWLPDIAAPTLLVWGRDDRVNTLDMALVPMRLIPRCELHVLYDCGHWAMIERRAEFESTVLGFLARQEPAS